MVYMILAMILAHRGDTIMNVGEINDHDMVE
jgi:hypothetical protein